MTDSDQRAPEGLTLRRFTHRWTDRLSLPVDSTFLVVFRVVLGTTFFFWAQGYITDERYHALFVEPQLLFKYAGFEWVQVWPGDGIFWHFRITQVAAIFLCVGLLSRLSAATLSFSMTYVLLVERQIYNNHDYLLACTAAVMVFLPTSSRFAVDQWIGLERPRARIGRWQLWLVRFQLGMPYVFGAIAKLNWDWLRGQPAELFLMGRDNTPVIGSLMALAGSKWVMAYGGIAFDFLIVPLLMYRRTRVIAIVLAMSFHLTNATIFTIGVFPWFMLATLYIFFPPEIIARVVSRWFGSGIRKGWRNRARHGRTGLVSRRSGAVWGLSLVIGYVVVQLLLPLRPWVLPGDPSWNERGHRFAWRMMLRHKETLTWFRIENESGFLLAPSTLVMTPYQSSRAERDPELIRQAAVKIKALAEQMGQPDCRVYALSLASLNGRRAVPIIDPDVDLASVKRGWLWDDWVNQDPGPFLEQPWRVAKENWWRELKLPDRFAALQGQSLAKWEGDFRRYAQQQRELAAQQNRGPDSR